MICLGDLFDKYDLDSKDKKTMTQQELLDRLKVAAEKNGTVGSISTERDGSTGHPKYWNSWTEKKLRRVSDTAGTVADGERKELLGQRSSRSTSRGNHGDGEAERCLNETNTGDRD